MLGRVGAYCGSVSRSKGRMWASDNTIVVKCDTNKSDINFCYYLLPTLKLNNYAGGAAQPLITQTILKQISCNLPPLPIQQKIADVLGAYDDLIENNRRRIELLEKMARELYRERFVRRRVEGNLRLLSEIFEFKRGDSITKNDVVSCPTNEMPYTVYGAGREVFGYYRTANVKDKVVVLAAIGAGAGEVQRTHSCKSFITSNSYIVRSKIADAFGFMYLFMLNFNFKAYNTGAAQPQLPYKGICDVSVSIPSESQIKGFSAIVDPLLEEQDALILQNRNLAKQRDRLLPRLMSGKLDVSKLVKEGV